jgi:hypothetical protein
MRPGPITSQCLPPEYSSEFRVVTIDFKSGKEIEPVYVGASEERASQAFIETVKRIERDRGDGQEWEPTVVKILESGETQEELLIA